MSQAIVPKPKLERSGYFRLITVLGILALDAALLFLAAGTLTWPAAWIYLGMRVVALVIAGAIVVRVNPEIVNERGRMPRNTKSFDKLFGVFYLVLTILLPLVAGWDYRMDWSNMPAWLQFVGVVGTIPALILPYWAMMVNNYLTTTVRIQDERGHRVISGGPYRYVRHPMYVGLVLSSLCTPLLLGSWWALIPGGLTVLITLWRTGREDKVLREELVGYEAYAERTPYRLLPGIW